MAGENRPVPTKCSEPASVASPSHDRVYQSMPLYGIIRRFHVETLHERGRNPRRTDRPRPESGRLGRGGGKPCAARGHHPRPPTGRGRARRPGHRRLCVDLPQPQARRDRGQAAGSARYRRPRPGQEIRRETANPLRLLHQWRRHLPGRYDDRRGAVRHRNIPRRTNSGTASSRNRMSGATVSPPSRSRTRAATGRRATTRTSPSGACWRPSPRDRTASC